MDVSSVLFLYFVRASSLSFSLATSIFELQLHLPVHLCFGNEMLIELFEKFKDNLITCASFVSATFIYLLEIFILFSVPRIFMRIRSLSSVRLLKITKFLQFDKQNFQNIYSRN